MFPTLKHWKLLQSFLCKYLYFDKISHSSAYLIFMISVAVLNSCFSYYLQNIIYFLGILIYESIIMNEDDENSILL